MIEIREVKKKDLELLANIYSLIYFNVPAKEDMSYEDSFSYLEYFYKHQPDLFLCAIEDNIPVGAVMSILRPCANGLYLSDTEVFVIEDYRNKNLGLKLLSKQFEIADAKYNVNYSKTLCYKTDNNWYEKAGYSVQNDIVVLKCNIQKFLENNV